MSAVVAEFPAPREYVAEMRALLDSEANGDPAPVVAERVVGRLRTTDPDLLAGWLDVQAVSLVRDAVGYIDRSGRARARATSARSVFADDAERGDVSGWLSTRYVLDDGRRPTLAEMTAGDLRFVAGQYDAEAKAAKTEAAFMRSIAKRVGSGVVADVFTEEQIDALRRSLVPSG